MRRRVLGADWRTTFAGIAAMAVGAALMILGKEADSKATGAGLVAVGLGLLKAKDA